MSRITSVILLSNALNIIAILAAFMNDGASHLLTAWAVCGLFMIGWAYVKHAQYLRIEPKRRNNKRAIRDYIGVSGAMGLLWGTVPLIVMAEADPYGQMVMGIVAAGMMFAGGFLLSRLPLAAMIFMLPTASGTALALLMQPGPQHFLMSVLMSYYLIVLTIAVLWTHRQFVEQYLGEAAIQEQSQLIGLLLRDFGESTSDSLWQTDEQGVLQDIPVVSEAATRLWAQHREMRPGALLNTMFAPGDARDALEQALSSKSPFRDIVVPVRGSVERWWSVTGKPVIEGDSFLGFRGVVSDVTQSREIENKIAHMAHYDSLTGLPNRVTLRTRLEEALSTIRACAGCRALMMLDLDNFKWVNDTLGHPAGDELLRQVTGRITALSADGDFIARLGGDEFAIIVERADHTLLQAFLDNFTRQMSEHYDIWGATVNCSASVGVRVFNPDVKDVAMMLRHADLALYQSKHMGRAKWSMFSRELEDRAKARLAIEEELQHALERNELRVHFQPIVAAGNHEIVACETLLRWEHPQRGLVYPGEFIEQAEENGLITRMGEWVIRTALMEARCLPEHVRISINISPLQIHSSTLVSTIINAVAASGVDPRRVELEVTEAALMSNTEVTLRRLHQLREIGISITLDDFGVGLSSLRFLRAFPFDRIKIDRSFAREIETREDVRQIMSATVSLARSLGMRCTAEGVETADQADHLRELGCEELQGWFISRATPMNQLAHLLPIRAISASEDELIADATSIPEESERDAYGARSRAVS